MRRNTTWYRTAATTIAILAIGSCGPIGADMVSDAMVDTGTVMMDAGRTLIDGGGGLRDAADGMMPDARAETGMVLEAPCEESYSWVQRASNVGGLFLTSTTTGWAAELNVPGLSEMNVRHVTVVRCDLVTFGTTPTSCPASTGSITWECSGTPPPASLRCNVSGAAELEGDRVRVGCGVRTENDYADPGTTDTVTGQRWTTVRLIVDT